MDPTQITIVVISFTLTVLIIVLSIQVWGILKEMRSAFGKMNKMLDDMGKMTGAVGNSFTEMSTFVNGLKSGMSFFSTFLKKKEEHHE